MKTWLFLAIAITIYSCRFPIDKTKTSDEYLLLKERIELGLDQDQEIREAFSKKMQETGYVDLDLNKKMGVIDSLNQFYAIEYLNTYGYPSLSIDGTKLSDGIFYILQHSDSHIMKMYLNGLKEKAFRGEASKTHYAMMQDRILMNDGKKQIYGSQLSPRKDDNGANTSNYFVWPIEDNANVDKLRLEMGFTKTISESVKEWGAEYNINEELPKKYH